jgi:hypothetical protein
MLPLTTRPRQAPAVTNRFGVLNDFFVGLFFMIFLVPLGCCKIFLYGQPTATWRLNCFVHFVMLIFLNPVSPLSCLAVTMPEACVPGIEAVEMISQLL